jgi:hypothetical protein
LCGSNVDHEPHSAEFKRLLNDREWFVYKDFMGLEGIEPSASALSGTVSS